MVGVSDIAPEAWEGEFEVAFFDCEHNPFNNKPFFNEVGSKATGTKMIIAMMMMVVVVVMVVMMINSVEPSPHAGSVCTITTR